jgi:hypothetical protein
VQVNDSRNWISVSDFTDLLKAAEKAVKRKDQVTFDKINERLGQIGYRLVIKLDGVYIENKEQS